MDALGGGRGPRSGSDETCQGIPEVTMNISFFARLGGSLLLSLCMTTDVADARGDLWQSLGLKKRAEGWAALSEELVVSGLREALAKGVGSAVAGLGRTNGFLGDAKVRIPLPSGLQRTEAALRRLGQGERVDAFVATLNRAAEQAMPEAAVVLADAVLRMTVEDARGILQATNAAATDYFRRTSRKELHARVLPLVGKATEQTGVTAGYKGLLELAGGSRSGFLGGLGRSLLGVDSLDLDEYVTQRALDGLFLKIGEEEVRIRENPGARTTELLRQVFGVRAR